jgi:hypothetical protein
MDNDKSILEKITNTVKDIANIAADAANHALKADEPGAEGGRAGGRLYAAGIRRSGVRSADGPADRHGARSQEARRIETDGEDGGQDRGEKGCQEIRGEKIKEDSQEGVQKGEQEGREEGCEKPQRKAPFVGRNSEAYCAAVDGCAGAAGGLRFADPLYYVSAFDTRNFNSSTFVSRNFSSGDVLASL